MSFANNLPLINSKVGMYDSVNLVEYEMCTVKMFNYKDIFVMHKISVIA